MCESIDSLAIYSRASFSVAPVSLVSDAGDELVALVVPLGLLEEARSERSVTLRRETETWEGR